MPLPKIVQNHLDLGIDVRAVYNSGEVSFDFAKKLDFLGVGGRIVRRHSFIADFFFGNRRGIDPTEKVARSFKAARADPIRRNKIVFRKPAPGRRVAYRRLKASAAS